MTLTDKILGLPYQDRLSLFRSLKQSLRRPVDSNRGNVLLGYMEEILGEPIKLKSGLSRFVWARTMVAYQLTQERFSTLEIGRMLGKDHTTIIYMRDKMQDALSLPQAYRDILPIWNEFKKRIDNDIHKGTTENPVSLGGEFPDCSQGEMGKESGESRTPDHL